MGTLLARRNVRQAADSDQRQRKRVELKLESNRRDDPTRESRAEVGAENNGESIAHLNNARADECKHHQTDERATLKDGRHSSACDDTPNGTVGVVAQELAQPTARGELQRLLDLPHGEQEKAKPG